ncbi:hypothetical protein [Streptomyces sp. 8N706]|uniref:hypothetical protein n=1 Tax=Streptomyces sp. 8N706 TaxID=3457416 RepID=UPI003FD2DCB4
MNAMRTPMSLAAAAGILGAALAVARLTAPADGGAAAPGAVPDAAAPRSSPSLSFVYGPGELTESLDTPRTGICYALGTAGTATAFRNGSEQRAELFPDPDCGGRPGPALDPGQSATGTGPRSSVVFVVPGGGSAGR